MRSYDVTIPGYSFIVISPHTSEQVRHSVSDRMSVNPENVEVKNVGSRKAVQVDNEEQHV